MRKANIYIEAPEIDNQNWAIGEAFPIVIAFYCMYEVCCVLYRVRENVSRVMKVII